MIFPKSPELWVLFHCSHTMKYEHVVSVRDYAPRLLCSLASCTRPHAIPYRFSVRRCAPSPENHFCTGMLLPLP
jgi:hypothetical protein